MSKRPREEHSERDERKLKRLLTVKKIGHGGEKDAEDAKPLLGAELIGEKYCSIFLCARTKSGKTTALYHLLKNTVDRRTQIYIFCGSLQVDPAWRAIIDMLEKKKCKVVKFNGIIEKGRNVLKGVVDRLGAEDEKREERRRAKEKGWKPPDIIKVDNPDPGSDDEDEATKASRSKWDVPERVFVIDDVSRKELRDKEVCTALKKIRHYKARVFISGHNVVHMEPDAFEQLYLACVFKGFSAGYVEKLYERLPSCTIDKRQLQLLYETVTEEPHSFLSIYQWSGEFRKNFDLPPLDIKYVFRGEKRGAEGADGAERGGKRARVADPGVPSLQPTGP